VLPEAGRGGGVCVRNLRPIDHDERDCMRQAVKATSQGLAASKLAGQHLGHILWSPAPHPSLELGSPIAA
jgi:hypothetical protein